MAINEKFLKKLTAAIAGVNSLGGGAHLKQYIVVREAVWFAFLKQTHFDSQVTPP
ncbi:hypothetical protein QUF79_09685 [Fictibacillus enclensis]|uniref:hypothetical protein n=1 Tax=Fictibacillus enclensis TaxID=1017270 RepID=UPI0025A01BC6|nr:hypothetical protein [Fictibacillus enclensis]MDM5198283.1 hypothetical protein [Fictibacillus enclensis]